MKESSSTGSDPRQPSTAKPYVPPPFSPQDLPVDYAGFLAVVLGVIGVTFREADCEKVGAYCNHKWSFFGTRHVDLHICSSIGVCVAVMLVRRVVVGASMYKLCSWLAIIFCAESLVNMRNFESDLKQISMAMMFAIMGLVTTYFGPKRQPKAQP